MAVHQPMNKNSTFEMLDANILDAVISFMYNDAGDSIFEVVNVL